MSIASGKESFGLKRGKKNGQDNRVVRRKDLDEKVPSPNSG